MKTYQNITSRGFVAYGQEFNADVTETSIRIYGTNNHCYIGKEQFDRTFNVGDSVKCDKFSNAVLVGFSGSFVKIQGGYYNETIKVNLYNFISRNYKVY